MESQLSVSKSVNEAFQNQIISLEISVGKMNSIHNESVKFEIEIVGIPDTTNKTKVCDVVEMAIGVSIPLPVWKLIIVYLPIKMINLTSNFLEETVLKWFCQKNKAKGFNPCSFVIESGKFFINESLCHYYNFLWSKCENLWSEERIEAFWVSNDQIKIKIEP